MRKAQVFLMGVLCAFEAMALTNHQIINNLKGRMHPMPNRQGQLIKSFTNHTQSYIYDQALAIIAFSKSRDKKDAQKLLLGLQELQLKDGSLYFSYYLDGKSPYPQKGDKRFAGAIAWVALAAAHYQHQFKSTEFVGFNKKILSYLKSQMKNINVKGEKTRALAFSPSDISETQWAENETAALEHNLDAYVAFEHFAKLNGKKLWKNEVKDLKKFILSMWDKSHSHFWSGANIKTGYINKSELYLDNQTWSLLALDSASLKEISPKEALSLNCESFFVKHEGIEGFMDSKPTRRPASSKFVWSEGSLGQIMAMKKNNVQCEDKSHHDFLVSLKKMKTPDDGVAYATKTPNPDFTTASSVAGTAWMYFASTDFNPFKLGGT